MGLSPAKEGDYSHCWETRRLHRSRNAQLQQRIVNANRRARWRSCPLAICEQKQRSDGNQELDCRRKNGLFAVSSAGNKATMRASSGVLEDSIAT